MKPVKHCYTCADFRQRITDAERRNIEDITESWRDAWKLHLRWADDHREDQKT